MEIFDLVSGVYFVIKPYKNQYGRGYKHVAPDGSGWRDFKNRKTKEVKRVIIKGNNFQEMRKTISRLMKKYKMQAG